MRRLVSAQVATPLLSEFLKRALLGSAGDVTEKVKLYLLFHLFGLD